MNRQKLHTFCVALMLCASFIRLAEQVQLCLALRQAQKPTLWRVDVAPEPVPLVQKTEYMPAWTSPASNISDTSSTSDTSDSAATAPAGAQPQSNPEQAATAPGQDIETEQAANSKSASAGAPLVFLPEEADSIHIAGQCTYPVDKQALLLQPSTLDFSVDGPKVLIVHTHSSEAYTQEPGYEYTPTDVLRTQDAARSVIRVGSEIARILEDAGIEVLHDTAINDYPSYDGAYERMRKTIEQYLTEYPSIQIVLDVHRDAVEAADGGQAALTADVDGDACAKLMLVVGTDEGGLTHPDWHANLSNALKLQALLNRAAPGLCRDIDLRTERFNQHERPGSMLCEFGATGNTLSQALRSARIFAQALVQLVTGLETGS